LLKFEIYLLQNNFLVFLGYFDALMLKIKFKKYKINIILMRFQA